MGGGAVGVGVEAVVEANESGLGGLEFGEGEIGIGVERGAEGVAGAVDGIGDITDRVGTDAVELIAVEVERGGVLRGEGDGQEDRESEELHEQNLTGLSLA